MSLLHPPARRRQRRLRRAITALSVAVTAAVLAGVATAVPIPPLSPDAAAADTIAPGEDAAGTVTDAQVRQGPFRQPLGNGAALDYTITYGEDARLGPDAAGDGWHVHAAERLNVVDFYGVTPYSSTDPHVELYVVAGGGTPQPSDLRKQYDPWGCNCAHTSYGEPGLSTATWRGLEGGALWARVTFRMPTGQVDTGFVRLRASGCRCVLPAVRTAVQIENAPPSSSVSAPAQGAVVHRSTPEHRQEFSAWFADFEHHNITAFYEVYLLTEGGRQLATSYTAPVKAVPPPPGRLGWLTAGAYPLPVSTPPLDLPHVNGTYAIKVRAEDTSGRPTALGVWSQETTFEYIWNLPPAQPAQRVPSPGAAFPANVPVAFVAKATDAENDNVTLKTVVDGVSTYYSVPTASGRETVTVIEDGFAPGPHAAVVSGIDVNGEEGQQTPPVSFSAGALASTSNQPPGSPTLVAPASGGAIAPGAPQDFILRAVDPDGDAYRGVIEIADASANPVTAFATDEAPSGEPVTARPLAALAPGAYQWRARAFDSNGAIGPMSAWQPFSVGGSSGTVVSDDCAAGTTFAQAAAAGHYAHAQAAGSDVCWRVDGPAAASGGKLAVTMPGGSAPPIATVDNDTTACTTVLLDGTVGDPSDPSAYLRFRVATSVSPGEASLCIDLGGERRRVRQRFPGAAGMPAVAPAFDPPGRHSAVITPTTGLPSSACSGKPASITHLAGTAGPASAHLTSWQESPTRAHVCVRQQWAGGAGGPNVGGRLTVDTTNAGVGVPVETGTDFGPCSSAVASLGAPVQAEVRRSSAVNPVSICLAIAGARLRVTAGAGADPAPPTITWTPDPGTPGV